jgi:hypothetical protein
MQQSGLPFTVQAGRLRIVGCAPILVVGLFGRPTRVNRPSTMSSMLGLLGGERMLRIGLVSIALVSLVAVAVIMYLAHRRDRDTS